MGHSFGYARVSSGDQDARLQHDALTVLGCYRIYSDTAFGSLQSPPELDKLLDQLAALQERGVEFRSLQENLDTSGGRLVFHIFASPAEFEHDLIGERINAELEAARARGRVGGQPPLLRGDKLHTARQLYEQKDMTVAQIGEVLGVSRTTVYRALRRESGDLPQRRQKSAKPLQPIGAGEKPPLDAV